MKIVLGLLLGVLIGAGCRLLEIPLPAPQALIGALLVVAMTLGYIVIDRFATHREARHRELCGGPTGGASSMDKGS
jgi:XapX domain-containing protein